MNLQLNLKMNLNLLKTNLNLKMKAQPESVTNKTCSEHSNADVVDNTSIVLKEELRLKGDQLAGAIIGIRL